ncbi:uncharacterized protein LOC143209620 [Lasioglossum baleicum]|uniref:uncharacterized protein LOC143209620 n=1 Tax=Lasioglossum baleicum TaxID=434251 RepID=UPI003FCDAD62
MLKTCCTSFYRVKLQKYPWSQPSSAYSELLTQTTVKGIDEKGDLCKKENELLIEANETNKLDLKKYFKESQIKTLISHLSTNEAVKPVEELLLTNKVEVDTTSSPTKIATKKQKSERSRVRVTPKIKNLEMVKTTLAVHVGPTILSWSFVDCNFNLLDWNWHVWSGEKVKSRTFDLLNLVPSIVQTLPEADAYVMEDVQIPHKGNKNIQKLLTQQQLAASIMSCILVRDRLSPQSSMPSPSPLPSSSNKIYVLNTHSTAHWYNLFVGNEIISTDYAMKTLLNSEDIAQTDKLYASMNTELLDKYTKAEVDKREQINWSLLKALLFLRLAKGNNTKRRD